MVCATGIHLRFSGNGHRDCGTYKKCSEAPRPSTEEKIGCKHKFPGDGVTGERPRQKIPGYAAAGGAQRADNAEVGRLKRCLAAAPTMMEKARLFGRIWTGPPSVLSADDADIADADFAD